MIVEQQPQSSQRPDLYQPENTITVKSKLLISRTWFSAYLIRKSNGPESHEADLTDP
jgi:hypothetical protein